MKDKPIALQVWIYMTSFAVLISIIVVLVVGISINYYFNNNALSYVKTEQNMIIETINNNDSDNVNLFKQELNIDESGGIEHALIPIKEITDDRAYGEILQKVQGDIKNQRSDYSEYVSNYEDFKLFYIVKKITYNHESSFLVTVYLDKEQEHIMFELIRNVIRVIIIVFIINITLAKFFSKKITAPIRYLEGKVSEIANKEWNTEIDLDREDELGRLADSINMMKDSLKNKDIEEQTLIQTISHDLKTPVMIISSYSQALLDKVYINDSFEDTVKVIKKETRRLEMKIEKLLFLYCFDYVKNISNHCEKINLKQLIESIVSKLSMYRKDVEIFINVDDILILGNLVDLTQAFENILENNLRYAKSNISISSLIINSNLKDESHSKIKIELLNDGEPIDNTVINNLFNKNQKGKNGRFGLGLYITKKIIEFHKGEISAENLEAGVVFRVMLPLDKSFEKLTIT